MPARDVAQLILEVDARIATAQRSVNQLARAVQQDADKMNAALGGVAKAHDRLGKAMNDNGRVRSGLTQLSFQIGDVTQQMSMGVSASRVFAQQSGQVIQALQVMGGEGNKFLQFMGGPWGIAISTAAVILGPLAARLFDTGDEIDQLVGKMREQAAQAARNKKADEAWKRTIEGVTEAMRNRRDEQKKSLQTDIQQEQKSLDEARAELARQQQNLGKLREDLVNATIARSRIPQQTGTNLAGAAAPALAAADKRIAAIRRQITETEASIRGFEANIRGALVPIAERNVEARVDKTKAATDAYTQALGSLRDALQAGSITQKQFEDRLEVARRKLDAVKEAAKGAKKATDGDLTTFLSPVAGGKVTGHYGEERGSRRHAGRDLAVPVGTPVRAPADGVVIESGVVGAYGNVVYIDHGRGTISRLAHLSRLDVAKGTVVKAGEVVGLSGGAKGAPGAGNSQGPHVHQEVRVGGRPVDPSKGAFPTDPTAAGTGALRSAESEAEKAIRQQNAFSEEIARLDGELLRAKNELVQGIDAQADAAVAELQIAQAGRQAAYDNDVKEGKISQADAEILKAKVDQITFEKMKTVELSRQLDHMRDASEAEQRRFQYQADDLRFADEMARTQAERRRLQLQILDVVYQQKEAHLRALKAELELAGKIEEAASVQSQIDRLPTDKAQDQQRAERGTMNPLEAWADSVPQTAAEVIEAMQAIQARGLDSLADGISDVIMGTKSLGDAFKDVAGQIIADIIRMTIRMLIMRTLMSAFGGGVGGGAAPGNDIVVTSTGSGGFLGSGGWLPGRAAGGPVDAGRAYMVGERGPEVVVPRSPGMVIPNHRLGGAGGGDVLNIYQTFAPSYAGNAATREDLVRMASLTKIETMAAVREANRRRG